MSNSILNIRIYPDPVLKKTAEPIQEITGKHKRLATTMIETMYAAPGIGLAAPQVGVSLRLIVLHIPTEEKTTTPLVLINPRILEKEGEMIGEEGCLSFPEACGDVKRSSSVKVAYEDFDGKTRQIEGSDLLARILQHEIDHLDGILFIDYLGRIRRDLIKRKFRKRPPSTTHAPPDPEFLQAFKLS